MFLDKACEEFIKKKRNFSVAGHQRKCMFGVTCPFIDAEGLRFILITNNPYDFLNYKPTLDHVFLDEASIQGFERYVDLMFAPSEGNMCYFNILKTLLPDQFSDLDNIIRRGKYLQTSVSSDYKVPICLIPVLEFQALEDNSLFYSVKSPSVSLERTQIRLKLNSFFRAVLELLNCTEDDLTEVLYKKGVLPSKGFQLISTQKELTQGLKLARSCGDLMSDLGSKLLQYEREVGIVKPKFCQPNTNLCQALQCLFAFHPLYQQRLKSLFVETELIDSGKGRLARAIPNKKGTIVDNPKDQSRLPRKLLNDQFDWNEIMQQVEEAVATEFEQIIPEMRSIETQTEPMDYQSNDGDLLSAAMQICLPELVVPSGFDCVTVDKAVFSRDGVVVYLSDNFELCEEIVV